MPLQWRVWATFRQWNSTPSKQLAPLACAWTTPRRRAEPRAPGRARARPRSGSGPGRATEDWKKMGPQWLDGWFFNPRGTGMLRCWGRFLVEPGCQDVREGCLQAIGALFITWPSGKMGEPPPRMLPRCRYLVRDSRVVLCSASTRSEQVVLLRCCSNPHQLHNLHLSASLTSFAWETRHGLGTAAMRHLCAVLSVGSHLYGLQWRLRSTTGGVNMSLGSSWASKHNE